MTNGWVDIKNADVILAMGGNPAENHPCGVKWFVEAQKTVREVLKTDEGCKAMCEEMMKHDKTKKMMCEMIAKDPEAMKMIKGN